MTSHATAGYWRLFRALPKDVRAQAFKAHALFKRDPAHPSLHFELIDRQSNLWSARVNLNYRVLGTRDGAEITWFWVGTHSEYERLVHRA